MGCELERWPLDLSDLAPDPSWSFAHCKKSQTSKWTHCYHRYPAKFIPQLVERLYDEYLPEEGAFINDPFMGSGTAIVSALARGYRASGTDVNRLALLMTLVKSTPLEPRFLEERLQHFWQRLDSQALEPLIPQCHAARIEYWFRPPEKLKLGQLLRAIYTEEDERVQRFLLLAFSNILKPCSIWSQESTKPTRDFRKTPLEPGYALRRQLARMEKGNREYWEVVPKEVKVNPSAFLCLQAGDARHQPVATESVDLVVTSSPYVTSYEYADLHQLSTIWLDLAEDLARYKRSFIGTAHKRYQSPALTSPTARAIVAAMSEKSAAMAAEIEAFFADMQAVIRESHRILKPGGRACYVIGNTRLKGVDIRNAEVFAETMLSTGFALDRIIKRQIPSKILPQTRDARSGRFAATRQADNHAYPCEYIVIGRKPTKALPGLYPMATADAGSW